MSGKLLAVVNYPPNTGYAWDRLERIYASVADHLEEHGIPTVVAYPKLESSPSTLDGSAAEPVPLDATLSDWRSVQDTARFVRQEDVRVVYMMDRPSRHAAHLALRAAGVEHIVVHDNTSGERSRPAGVKRWLKRKAVQVPGILADRILTASEFVARRQLEVNLIPPERVTPVYYGVPVPPLDERGRERTKRRFGIERGGPVVACTARAVPDKGVDHLIRATKRLLDRWPAGEPSPSVVYCGDGPALGSLKELATDLGVEDAVVFAGYVPDALDELTGADVVAVPSVWEDAFPYAVLEAMARGLPVVATRTGGIPEQIRHEDTGLLVPPSDPNSLADALHRFLTHPDRAREAGRRAREWVEDRLDPDQQNRRFTAVVEEGFDFECFPTPAPIGERSGVDFTQVSSSQR